MTTCTRRVEKGPYIKQILKMKTPNNVLVNRAVYTPEPDMGDRFVHSISRYNVSGVEPLDPFQEHLLKCIGIFGMFELYPDSLFVLTIINCVNSIICR